MAQADTGSGTLSDATPNYGFGKRPPWMDEAGLEKPTIDPIDALLIFGSIGRVAIKVAAKTPMDITLEGLKHVFERHTIEGIRSVGKSLYTVEDEAVGELIQRAGQVVPRLQPETGNFVRILDAGKIIGVDRATGEGTSVYTVITDALGRLVTSFPGKP